MWNMSKVNNSDNKTTSIVNFEHVIAGWERSITLKWLNTFRSNVLIYLNLSWRRYLAYRNQSIDLQNKSIDWLQYYRNLLHEKVIWLLTLVLYSNCSRNSLTLQALTLQNDQIQSNNFRLTAEELPASSFRRELWFTTFILSYDVIL